MPPVRIRKPGPAALAHRQHRHDLRFRRADEIAARRLRGASPQFLTGPRAGQQLQHARASFDACSVYERRYLVRP